jgi:PadR family transcriptional regulator PadR
MSYDEVLLGLLGELRRGTIVLSVLSQLKRPQYGYSLIKVFQEKGIAVEANTLYPLLRRLESQGLLKSDWETEGSKPRKYYVLTEEGRRMYLVLIKHWKELERAMAELIGEDEHGVD